MDSLGDIAAASSYSDFLADLQVADDQVLRGRLIQGFRSLLGQIESGFLDECASKSFPPFRVVLGDFAAS